jgi:hypothetical protein
MKVWRKNPPIRNILTYLVFALFFLFSIQTLTAGSGFFNINALKLILKENYLTILLGVFSFYSCFKFHKLSKFAVLLLTVIISLKTFIILSSSFNKLVLGLDFIFIMFSFYFYTEWELFLDQAATTPRFSKHDCEKKSRFPISGKVILEGDAIPFQLTNIDEKGCFVLLSNKDEFKVKFGEKVKIEVNFENVVFQSSAMYLSKYENGFGFSFESDHKNRRSLSGLYQVCLDRGLLA